MIFNFWVLIMEISFCVEIWSFDEYMLVTLTFIDGNDAASEHCSKSEYGFAVNSKRLFLHYIGAKIIICKGSGRLCRRRRRWSAGETAAEDHIMLCSTPFINAVIGPRGADLLPRNFRLAEQQNSEFTWVT